MSSIAVQLTNEEAVDGAVQEIAALLRERHNVAQDDFTILSQKDILETVGQVTAGITLFLGSGRRYLAARWRHRDYEHHAGVRHGAHTRNRYPQSSRRQTK